ncbi:hypothetical protein EDB80DRAFT_752889 [Ilyonectria destructans]|nr:hypothetical protein EDB80DRAFT_752889 [Ilyonectria destructans]
MYLLTQLHWRLFQIYISLVKQDILEHLICKIAKYYIQINNKEGTLGTDSYININNKLIIIQLGADRQVLKQELSGDYKLATLVEALQAKLSYSRYKSHYYEEGGKLFDILAICIIDIAVLYKHLADLNQNTDRIADKIHKDIKDFLTRNRIGANTGLALVIRILKYLSRKLSLPKGALPKKIYTYLFTYYNKIHPTDSIKKEDKFYIIALTITDKLPDLLEIYKTLGCPAFR